MVLDLINNTIGGEEFISLPVALAMEYTSIKAELDSELIDRKAKKVIDWFANKHSRLGSDLMYVIVREDLNPAKTLHEVRCKNTDELQFNYSIEKTFR